MKLLLTAFDPFGGDPVNPALEAVKLVSGTVGAVQVVKLEVPTVFGKSIDKVAKAIEAERPDAVLCIGQAGGRFDLTPERVAINLDDAYTLAKNYPGVRGGFMHVPFIPSQVVNRPAAPSMNLQDIARGIEAAIAAIGENESDIVAAEGATH